MDANMTIPLLIGIIFGTLMFYEAYRIQKYRGVVKESRFEYIITLGITFIQPVLFSSDYFDQNDFILMYSFIGFTGIVVFFLNLYFGGKILTIYETTSQKLLTSLKSELDCLSIQYEEEAGFSNEECIFQITDGKANIKVSWWGEGTGNKKVKVAFKKWWDFPYYEEVQERIFEIYQTEREDKVFWKQILFNVLLGIGIIAFYIGLYIKFSVNI